MPPAIFFVEGNIGSGKSTFLKNIQSHFSNDQQTGLFKTSQFLQEPVDIWKNTIDSNGENI
jgi:uridine kinase